jgi:hypothetical protein
MHFPDASLSPGSNWLPAWPLGDVLKPTWAPIGVPGDVPDGDEGKAVPRLLEAESVSLGFIGPLVTCDVAGDAPDLAMDASSAIQQMAATRGAATVPR